MITPENVFHAKFYLEHNEARINHLDSLNLPIKKNMTVLEVGAGIGDHTKYFINLKCSIVTTEGRPENLPDLKKNVGEFADVALLDLENPEPNPLYDKKFDIVYCYGTLYHLSNPDFALTYLSQKCNNMLLLETCVSFGTHEAINVVHEHAGDPSQSVIGKGSRPTRVWLYNKMSSLFEYVYIPATQPNHNEFPLDWSKEPKTGLTRAIMIGSRNSIKNDLLLNSLPQKQKCFK